MAEENLIFKLILDPTQAESVIKGLDGTFSTADKSVQGFNETVQQGAKGLKDVAAAKKAFNDVSIAGSTKEVKDLTAALQETLVKDKEFMAVGKQVADAYKKGKIDQTQATKLLEDAINKGVEATKKMEVETIKVTQNVKSYRAQIAELKAILPTLSGNEYTQAQAKLANLTDAMGDQQAQIKLLASDTRGLDTAMQGLQAGVGIFAALQGASALFGSENEDIQKALLKVNAAMSILQGLQAVQNTLDKESGFVSSVKLYWQNLFNTAKVEEKVITEEGTVATTAATAATGLYGFVVGTSTGALKLFRIALAATGIGLFIIALGVLIANFDKIKNAIKTNSEGFQNFTKIMAYLVPPIYLIIKGIQYLTKNIDEIKDKLYGFAAASAQVFKSLGDAADNLFSGDFSKAYDNVKNIGRDVSNAYTEGYIEQEKANSTKRLGQRIDFLNQLRAKEIELLEAQGKDASALKARQVAGEYNALLQGLNENQKAELENAKSLLLKKNELTDEEVETLRGMSKEVKAVLDARFNIDLYYAKKTKEIQDKAADDAKAAAEKRAEAIKKAAEDFEKRRKDNTELDITLGNRDKPLDEKMLHELLDKAKEQVVELFASQKIEVQPLIDIGTDLADNKKAIENFRSSLESSLGIVTDDNFKKLFEGVGKFIETLADKTLTDIEKVVGAISGLGEIGNGLLGVADEAVDRNIAGIQRAEDRQKESIQRATELANQGNSQLLDAEIKKQEKLEQLEKKERAKKKQIAIGTALINTAVAVTSALATQPFLPLGPIAAGLAAALGAVQIGIISSQQFAKGGQVPYGEIDAPSHGQGGAKFTLRGRRDYVGEYEGGEFIHDKEYTQKNLKELNYIHKNRINLSDVLRMNQIPAISMIPIMSNYHVNEMGELSKKMSAIESAIKELPAFMPTSNLSVDENGWANRQKRIIAKQQNWNR